LANTYTIQKKSLGRLERIMSENLFPADVDGFEPPTDYERMEERVVELEKALQDSDASVALLRKRIREERTKKAELEKALREIADYAESKPDLSDEAIKQGYGGLSPAWVLMVADGALSGETT
jgi:predicted  nucleic acid-binding Zn-ribbon protein